MASSKDFVEFVTDQLSGIGTLRYRKMFGEYCIYVNEKPIILICDNQVFIKIIPELAQIMANAEKGLPYEGASIRYRLDIENRDLARTAIAILEQNTPLPKPKRKKQK